MPRAGYVLPTLGGMLFGHIFVYVTILDSWIQSPASLLLLVAWWLLGKRLSRCSEAWDHYRVLRHVTCCNHLPSSYQDYELVLHMQLCFADMACVFSLDAARFANLESLHSELKRLLENL